MSDTERVKVPLEVTIPFEEVDCTGSIECGFRTVHLSAQNETMELILTSGAGCGSPWISGDVKDLKTGKKRYFRIHAGHLLANVIETMTGEKITFGQSDVEIAVEVESDLLDAEEDEDEDEDEASR